MGMFAVLFFFWSVVLRSLFDRALARKKESRKRNLNFHIPAAISCSPNLRLLQNDSSYVTLGDIYDRHCEETGITREDPILVSGEKVKSVLSDFKQVNQRAVCIYRHPASSGFLIPPSPARQNISLFGKTLWTRWWRNSFRMTSLPRSVALNRSFVNLILTPPSICSVS